MKTDLRALSQAMLTNNTRVIASILFAQPGPRAVLSAVPDPPTSPERPEDYDARPMAIHSVRRLLVALERGYTIKRDELDILLNFIYEVQSDLDPTASDPKECA